MAVVRMERSCNPKIWVKNCILVPKYWFPHSAKHFQSQNYTDIHPILSVLRRPCQVPEAMAVNNKEGQSLSYICQSKWNWSRPRQSLKEWGYGISCGIRMEVTAGEREGVDGIWPPNGDEKHTPLISVMCTKEVLHSQTSFCNIDLKALLNSIT